MSFSLDKLTIKGFKSIEFIDEFELKALNIVVGANGAGKSNFVSFFKLLNELINNRLNSYVVVTGGARDMLFNGKQPADKIEFSTRFGRHGFRFSLVPTVKDEFMIEDEARFDQHQPDGWLALGSNTQGQSKMVHEACNDDSKNSFKIYQAIKQWQIYHFHDTSSKAKMRHYDIVENNEKLAIDASNIAPFLLKLKNQYQRAYKQILAACQLVMPFLDDFILKEVTRGQKREVNLSWRQKDSDYPFQPYHLSDGSIRFICLATALLQPTPPSTIIFDEPELGLHPSALQVLAELIGAAATRMQVIVATQSPILIDQFAVEDIVTVNRVNGATSFKRLHEDELKQWLEDYSLGELWVKNVIQAGANYE